MKFSDGELKHLIMDIENLIKEFEEMPAEEREASSAMEKDVRSILDRLLKYHQLDQEERKILHQHIYTLYNFLDQIDEDEGDEEFKERIAGKLEEIDNALESVVTTVKGSKKEEFGSMHEFTSEMNAIVKALSDPKGLSEEELRELEKKLDKLEKKFDDTYHTE